MSIVSRPRLALLVGLVVGMSGCSGPTTQLSNTQQQPPLPATTFQTGTTASAAPSTASASTSSAPTTTAPVSPFARPSWLGTRSLPTRPDGYGEVQPTPPELRDRQLETLDLLPPPGGSEFQWTIEAVPDEVVLRSTWGSDCPVSRDELAYVTISHFGFDGGFHTGELLVNADAASGLVAVFRRLHEDRFPIEQMRVIHAEELNEPPTGDGNVTTSFVCRPAVGSTRWSQHAFGLAVDINPFHNPYSKGDLVLPELATAYTDRTEVRSGMVVPGDVVTDAFVDIGWGWGGNWNTLKDWMHFSRNGN